MTTVYDVLSPATNTTDDGKPQEDGSSDSGGRSGGIMTEIILISCAFILGGIFGMIIGNFMR